MARSSAETAFGRSRFAGWWRSARFVGSDAYWERRYSAGGTSGAGSYGAAASWKAKWVNRWIKDNGISSVVDLGCGDGGQLALADYPRYLGLDRSASAIKRCIQQFEGDSTKSFVRFDPETTSDPAGWLKGDAALSLEVIFHLVEDDVRERYLRHLFNAADRFVIICSSDRGGIAQGPHERHAPFTPWITAKAPEWSLLEREAPPAETNLVSEMFLYGRTSTS